MEPSDSGAGEKANVRDGGGSHGFEIETLELDKYSVSAVMRLLKAVRDKGDSGGVS